MRKILIFLFVTISALVHAADIEVNGLYYNYGSDLTLSVATSNGQYAGNIVIPQTVTIENVDYTVTGIDEYAFMMCNSLTSVSLPSSITRMGAFAFFGNTSIEQILVAEDNPVYMSENGILFNKDQSELIVFPANMKLNAYSVPESTISIDSYAFYWCSHLQSINLNQNVKTIGDYAFGGCSSLSSLTIPENVCEIGLGAFYYCAGLEEINVSERNTFYSSVDGVIFNSDGSVLIAWPNAHSSAYCIPENVTQIGDYAFAGCTDLKDISFASSVQEMGEYAFAYCYGLERIAVNEGCVRIGSHAFDNCNNLTKVSLPATMETIEEFAFSFCSALQDFTSLSNIPPLCEESTFAFANTSNCTLNVPEGRKEEYAKATGWKDFAGIQEVSGVASIMSESQQDAPIYDLRGLPVSHIIPGKIYIREGRKIIFN